MTVIACEFTSAMLHRWMDQGEPFAAELSRIASVGIVELPTGHWPQFTRPVDLGRLIAASITA